VVVTRSSVVSVSTPVTSRGAPSLSLLLASTAEGLAVVGLVPLTEGGSVNLDNGGLKTESAIERQFESGRLFAVVASRPGQSGRCDGYILLLGDGGGLLLLSSLSLLLASTAEGLAVVGLVPLTDYRAPVRVRSSVRRCRLPPRPVRPL
jgi:hypothetical protein